MRSTILTSQLPVSKWHEQIGDPTLADGILDRLVHNAHRIEMRGDSMRKGRITKPTGWRRFSSLGQSLPHFLQSACNERPEPLGIAGVFLHKY